jgi:two-component sensor histidine kinase
MTSFASIVVTEQLLERTGFAADYRREKDAIQDLAAHMADRPEELLPRLVGLAMELCDAAAAGISVLEGERFRWLALQGRLSTFEGETTPRHFSPCGVCLDQGQAVLMERPERVYGWISDAGLSIPEVLLVPIFLSNDEPLGTLWVVAHEGCTFHAGHAQTMTELATFTGRALRIVLAEERLEEALERQETLTREMSHRVKNLFTVVDGLIRMTAQSAATKEEFAESLSGRIRALAEADGMVRRHVDESAGQDMPSLGELVAAVLRPYGEPALSGPSVPLGERSVNSLALMFHELATNAVKYGALSTESGTVSVTWQLEGRSVVLIWRESGGPDVSSPASLGFGSKLIASTVSSHGGTVEFHWSTEGLVVCFHLRLEALAL